MGEFSGICKVCLEPYDGICAFEGCPYGHTPIRSAPADVGRGEPTGPSVRTAAGRAGASPRSEAAATGPEARPARGLATQPSVRRTKKEEVE